MTDTPTDTWPGAPGVPGKSGAYVLRRKDGFEFPAWWSADDHWTLRGGARMRAEALANLGTALVGPMLTPAEVAAREAAAKADGMREAAGIARERDDDGCFIWADGWDIAEAIEEAIPDPSP